MNKRTIFSTVLFVFIFHIALISLYLIKTDKIGSVSPYFITNTKASNSPSTHKIREPSNFDIVPVFPEVKRGKLYSWVDDKGVKNFSDFKPSGYVSNLSVKDSEPQFLSPTDDNSKLSIPNKKIFETRIFLQGNRVLIPVNLGYNGIEKSVLLTFDTGASTTCIHAEVAMDLNLSGLKPSKSIVADGRLINSPKTNLDYIQVGPYKMINHEVSVIYNHEKSSMDKGLLGMNFLKNVDYKFDFENRTIKWLI